jgi:transcriptional regulator with XRE-family HTH domain
MREKNLALALMLLRAKLTGREAASKAGLSAETVSGLLNRRRNPKPETIKALARTLSCKSSELGFGEVGHE